MDINKFSKEYRVRKLEADDAPIILEIQKEHPLYYEFCPPEPSIKGVLKDLKALPPGKNYEDKYYLGFFDADRLIAIMDLIVSFPKEETAFLGFFMIDSRESGKGKGSLIIEDFLKAIKLEGYKKVRLGYMKGNPQSKAFWNKCGFSEIGIEVENGQGTMVILEKSL